MNQNVSFLAVNPPCHHDVPVHLPTASPRLFAAESGNLGELSVQLEFGTNPNVSWWQEWQDIKVQGWDWDKFEGMVLCLWIGHSQSIVILMLCYLGGFCGDGRRKKQEVLKTISVGVYQFWSNHIRGFLQENLTDGNLQQKDLAENGTMMQPGIEKYIESPWTVDYITFPRRWFQTRKSSCFNLALSWDDTPGRKIAVLNSPWFFRQVQPVFQIETTTYRSQ